MIQLSGRAKRYLKVRFRQASRLYVDLFHAFSEADLERALGAIGINTGDTVFVHSSYDAFRGFAGKPTDILAVLRNAVGSIGTVMMPTLPFTGTAVEYALANPIFDVRRTPSRTGLLTELFRRMPDVTRSVHPTHSVAVWGRDAAALVEGHHLAGTPCGRGSPYARLLDRGGRILLMGTDIGALTFYHAIEEFLENRMQMSPFTADFFVMQSRDYSGTIVSTRTRLFEPAISKRRNLYKLVPELRQRALWRQGGVGQLQMTLLNAADVLLTVSAMIDKGIYCYD